MRALFFLQKLRNGLYQVKKRLRARPKCADSYHSVCVQSHLANCSPVKQSIYTTVITVRYNTVLDITLFKDGSQKWIDYIEK